MTNNFITQFRKAKANKMRLIYDANENRYLITHNKVWQTWYKCTLIFNFK
jgi:hypothetical protein